MSQTWKRSAHAILFVLIGFIPALALSQTPADLAGAWEGAIKLPGTELSIAIDFKQADEAWRGEIDIPQQGAKDLPLANITREGAKVSFELTNTPGNPSFKGTLAADGQSLSGDFTQAGQTFPFSLKRKSAAAASQESAERARALQKIRVFADSVRKVWKVPGLGLAIVKNGEVIMSEGFGHRNVKEQLPVTSNTLFAIGSSSKAFTAMCVGILADEGKVEWDKPLRNYLPTFKLHDDFASARMTPRDLVTHRSGLPRHDMLWYGSSFTRKEMFERLQYLEPSKDFRTDYQYQNLMFMTAGYLVEQINGGTWEDFVRSRIFKPLGMTSSNFSVLESQKAADFALPYQEKKEVVTQIPFRDITAIGPAGSINSNLADMSKWVLLNLNKGKAGETQVLSEAGLVQMHTPYMAIAQPLKYTELSHNNYGLGWFIRSYRGHAQVSHGGNIDGFSALVSLFPQDNFGTVLLTNLNGNPLPGIVNNYVSEVLLNLEPVDWHARVKADIDKAKEEGKKKEADEQATRKPDTKPSHALADYAGEFEHAGYGVLKISSDGKVLKGRFNAFTIAMEHWHYDVFRGTLLEDEEEKMLLSFLTNEKGDLDRVSVPLEPAVQPIIFTRKASAQMFDPKFLAQFIGEYELSGQSVTVALRGEKTLTLTVPGQPTYELEPYKDTEFNLKSLTGYSVKFTMEKGKATAVVFHQPNGVFTAVRKK
ncbi:serine hydrolase [candidate division KSB1 bacterium]|nr:serine hydrolase [candidate division KSB1 bacterium]